MSEFTENYKKRVEDLTAYTIGLIEGRNGAELLKTYAIKEQKFMPHDILMLFDNLFDKNLDIEDIKTASNKLFNILSDDLAGYPKYNYPENSVVAYLIRDNRGVSEYLGGIKKHIKNVNKGEASAVDSLYEAFEKLADFMTHYSLKENIVFPEIERNWDNYQCLKLMWSIHDDIRRNIKNILKVLRTIPFDLELFNKLCGKLYFNINTLIFREDNILFPIMYETMNDDIFKRMDSQVKDFKLLFAEWVETSVAGEEDSKEVKMDNSHTVKFSTGELKLEQLELIFSHLPVDLTFVDENDRVRYFSAPKERIFPRTVGIIGRKVEDCHPHESVGVVKKIVASFKSGEKDDASFWLQMGPKFVLIRYFAVRTSTGKYKGVLEVSQEVSDIRSLEGENRLLDWK